MGSWREKDTTTIKSHQGKRISSLSFPFFSLGVSSQSETFRGTAPPGISESRGSFAAKYRDESSVLMLLCLRLVLHTEGCIFCEILSV